MRKVKNLEIKKIEEHLANLKLAYEATKISRDVRIGKMGTISQEELERKYGIK